jgi:hypothetical protein
LAAGCRLERAKPCSRRGNGRKTEPRHKVSLDFRFSFAYHRLA